LVSEIIDYVFAFLSFAFLKSSVPKTIDFARHAHAKGWQGRSEISARLNHPNAYEPIGSKMTDRAT